MDAIRRLRASAVAVGATLALVGGVAAPAATASGGAGSGPLCQVLYDNTAMYDAPNGTQDWWMNSNEQFRRHQVSPNGFWSYGHSTNSFPYDYWVRSSSISC